MQGPIHPEAQPLGDAPPPNDRHGERPGIGVHLCTLALMAIAAFGVLAIECGFYRALDDNWFDLSRSAVPSVLALLQLEAQPVRKVDATPGAGVDR